MNRPDENTDQINPLLSGFGINSGSNPFVQPDYRSRYDWFVSEFVQYNLEIPESLINEYNALFSLFGQDAQDKSIEKRLEKYVVKLGDEVPMPEIVLSVCDASGNNKRMVMTRQNISCITAQAKVGKTFLVKLITGCFLKKGVFQNRLHSELPEGRDRVLYIDTEQSKFHVTLGLNQIKTLIGEENRHLFDRLSVYQFDSVSTTDRLEYVRHLLMSKSFDVVIIDGISDLSLDSNNLKEADELVTNLRIWATESDCHIINIIHLNPSDIVTKMKGHLGTKLMDKSEIVINVSIDKENDTMRIVQSMASRNRKPDPFQFTILETGVPEICEIEPSTFQLTGKKPQKADKPDHELYQLLTSHFSKQEGLGSKYSELVSGVCLQYEKRYKTPIGDNLAKKMVTRFVDSGWVLKTVPEGQKLQLYFLGEFPEANQNGNNNFSAGNFYDDKTDYSDVF